MRHSSRWGTLILPDGLTVAQLDKIEVARDAARDAHDGPLSDIAARFILFDAALAAGVVDWEPGSVSDLKTEAPKHAGLVRWAGEHIAAMIVQEYEPAPKA